MAIISYKRKCGFFHPQPGLLEEDLISSMVAKFWIGASRLNNENSTWTWIDGRPFNQSLWHEGEHYINDDGDDDYDYDDDDDDDDDNGGGGF